ncbi:MAG: ApbE family protein [Gammaproteobacteria bacterium]|nr:ApbE family protein [Gammaproteobacteria bacterium]
MGSPSRPSCITSRLRLGMGTFVAVEARGESREISESGALRAFEAVADVERLMHPARSGSDLAAMRDCPLGVPLRVHRWTWETLQLCTRLHRWSHGIFDPCLPGWGGRLRDLQLVHPFSVIQHARLLLDLGGIAKGFAVDRAIDAMRMAGCHGGVVNAGGDLAAYGDQEHLVWCRQRDRTSVIELRNAALAISETDNESRPTEHQGYYNGADRAAKVSGYAAVVATQAAVADALTKCLLAGDRPWNTALLKAVGARRIGFEESR